MHGFPRKGWFAHPWFFINPFYSLQGVTNDMEQKRNSPSGFFARVVVVSSCAISLAGCAGLSDAGKTPEQIVSERVEARWKALLAGDFEKAYSLMAPSYREAVGFERYKAQSGSAVNRQGAELVNVECEAERCEATVRVDFTLPLRQRDGVQHTHVVERWVSEKGGWWLYQRF